MAIVKYARGTKGNITTNLTIEEFQCKCGKCSATVHDEALSFGLQKIRTHYGLPLIITSGYRCPTHNADPNVGGASQSYHTKGMAADFYVVGVECSEVAAYAESIGFYGIGLYDGYVHVDTRPKEKMAFWKTSDQIPVKTFIKDVAPKTTAKELADKIRALLKSYNL